MVIVIPTPIADILVAFMVSYLASWLYDRRKKR